MTEQEFLHRILLEQVYPYQMVDDKRQLDDVHSILMGMSEGEWAIFNNKLVLTAPLNTHWGIEQTLKTPLLTLIECYLEATKERGAAARRVEGVKETPSSTYPDFNTTKNI